MATAEIKVVGQPSEVSNAYSRAGNDPQSVREGFVSLPPEGERILKPVQNPADKIPREFDTEFKILEDFAQKYKANQEVQGTINLYTERSPCDSCTNAIRRQFKELYPNVEVRVYHGNGEASVVRGEQVTTIKMPSTNREGWPASPDLPKPPTKPIFKK